MSEYPNGHTELFFTQSWAKIIFFVDQITLIRYAVYNLMH